MRSEFKTSSTRILNGISHVEVISLFKDGGYSHGFFDRKCCDVEPLIQASGLCLPMDDPFIDMKMNILLEGKALHFEVMHYSSARKPFLEFEFFISDMAPDILTSLKEAASIDGHSARKEQLVEAMANSVVTDLMTRELFQITNEEIAKLAFIEIFNAWYEAEIQDRPVEMQTWHQPRSQFTEDTMKPAP